VRHAAFLRAINLGKHNKVRMQDLRPALEAAGLRRVSTHLQTGNVLFEAEGSRDEIALAIEAVMVALGCVNVSAMVRTSAEMNHLAAIQPFDPAPVPDVRHCITFLREPSALVLPARNTKADLEVLHTTNLDVFTRLHPVVNGASPNAFVESKLKVPATTRFWNVAETVAGLLREE
jgi:uncharacterized protein (DUF1697 family)